MGYLPAHKSIAEIAKKNAMGRLEFEQQLEARRGLGFGIHFRNTKARALVDGRKLGSGGRNSPIIAEGWIVAGMPEVPLPSECSNCPNPPGVLTARL
jgi:hypothetical protein